MSVPSAVADGCVNLSECPFATANGTEMIRCIEITLDPLTRTKREENSVLWMTPCKIDLRLPGGIQNVPRAYGHADARGAHAARH